MHKQHHNELWLNIDTDTLISGVTADGVRYLKLFLIDYKELFKIEALNASCPSCIRDYLNNYKKAFTMENNCKYKLKEKYNGLPLEFGSAIYVTNNNITYEYANKLLERYDPETIFESFPKSKEVISENQQNKKNKKNKR